MKEIYDRASVRAFTDEPVTEGEIELLARAGMAAPSANMPQPRYFYAVSNRTILDQLRKVSPYAGPIDSAPLTIIPCVDTRNLMFPGIELEDGVAGIENLLLEVVHLKLGACWMGVAPKAPERSEGMNKIASILDLPDYLDPIALIAVGHPAEGAVNARCREYFTEDHLIRI